MANQKSQPRLQIVDDPEIKRAYSNYISVTTGPHECNLTFCHIDPLGKSPTRAEARVVAKVLIPNSLVKEMIGVIDKNYEKTMKKMKEIQPKS